jgi:hypothetical protein
MVVDPPLMKLQCFGGGYDCITTIAEAIAAANVGGQTTVAKGALHVHAVQNTLRICSLAQALT